MRKNKAKDKTSIQKGRISERWKPKTNPLNPWKCVTTVTIEEKLKLNG